MAIEWEKKYETGEERIDKQHQNLFQMINNVEQMLKMPQVEEEKLKDVLRFLTNYTRIHFVYEEFCMARVKCPLAEKNMVAHDKFMEALKDVERRFRSEGASRALLVDIYDMASEWLVKHICKIDTELKPAMRAHGEL